MGDRGAGCDARSAAHGEHPGLNRQFEEGRRLSPQFSSVLFDGHVHTELAVCAEDITAHAAVKRAADLAFSIGFAEHADQLYFPRDRFAEFEGRIGLLKTLESAQDAGWSRIPAYRALVAPFQSRGIPAGLEVEAAEDRRGLVLLDSDREGWDYLIGAVHEFRGMDGRTEPDRDLIRDFLDQVGKLVDCGVDVLGHPFRVFQRKQRPVPAELYRQVAGMLKSNAVAAEINFHTYRPEPEFYSMCLDMGIRLATGSDSHAVREVGALERHAEFLAELGATGRLTDVLWRPFKREPTK